MKIEKKTGLYYFGLKEIRSWKPCYDPSKYLPENWQGTAIDILKQDGISHSDKMWCIVRAKSGLLSTLNKQLFAIWCARQAQPLTEDPRSIQALDTAELFLQGRCTKKVVKSADAAAYAAAGGGAAYAAAYAAIAAAVYATAAPVYATDAAAYAAIAGGAAAGATGAAIAAGAAVAEKHRLAQREKLIQMFLDEGLERLNKRKK